MQLQLVQWFIEKVVDPDGVLAAYSVIPDSVAESVSQEHRFLVRKLHRLVHALCIYVEHACLACVESLVDWGTYLRALSRMVAKPAGALEHIELFLCDKTVKEQELVLVDAEIDVVARLVALSWVGAGIADHYSFEVHCHSPLL